MPTNLLQISFDDEPVADEFYGDLRHLEVSADVTQGTTFSLALALELDDSGEWTYTDDDRFALFTKVGIGVGFGGGGQGAALGTAASGGTESVAECYVTGLSIHIGSDTGDASLELRGSDASVLLDLEEKVAAWPNMADSDIVQQIVSQYGFGLDAASTSPVHQEDETLVLQRGTDADFVRGLARRNGYEFYVDSSRDTPWYFGPPRLDGTPMPDLAVRFGDASNLLSFDLTVTGQRPLAVSARQLDARSKEDVTADAPAMQLSPLGAESLEDLVDDQLDALITPAEQQGLLRLLPQPTADQSELQTVVQAVRDEAGWLINARGAVNTDAYGAVLRPGRLVLVKGAGQRYSGKYYVTRVVHSIGPGSYRQSFEARRNASVLDGSETFGTGADTLGLPVG